MKISIEALLDYIECPMRYQLRYIQRVDTVLTNAKNGLPTLNAQSLEEAFDKEIHKIGYHIFNYVQDGKYPSEYLLRQKWGKIWCKDKTLKDVLMSDVTAPRADPMKRFEKQGVRAISHLHPHFKENPGHPILVGKRVDVQVGKHTVSVTIDLIRSVEIEGRDIIELVDFKSGIKTKSQYDTKPINLHIRQDVEMTAASLGFRQLTGVTEGHIIYYDMINNREYKTTRTESHYRTLEMILDNVEHALQSNIFYPVMNDRCSDCLFQSHCNQQSWYPEEDVT